MKVKKLTSTLLLSIVCSMGSQDVKAEEILGNNNQYSDDSMEEYENIQYAMESDFSENNDVSLNLIKIMSSIPFKLPVGVHSLNEFTNSRIENDLILVEKGLNSVKISYGGASAIVKIEGVDVKDDSSLVNNYTDLDINRWSYSIVSEAINRKLMSGVEYNLFSPQSKITVAQALSGFNTVALRNYDFELKNSRLVVQDLYSSLDSSRSEYRDILDITCRQNGSSGVLLLNEGNNLYTENMSRVLLARMLYFNFYDKGFNVDDSKAMQFSDCYSEDAINFVTATGLMTGYGSGKFNPSELVSREELASVLVRLDDMYKTESNVKNNKKDCITEIIESLERLQKTDIKNSSLRKEIREVLALIEQMI